MTESSMHARKNITMWPPYLCQDFSKYKITKKIGQDFVPIFNIFQKFLQVKNEKYYDRTLLWKMIFIDKLWQSINETNQESNYLQFCRSKTDCQFRIHCLLEAVCYLTFSSTRPPPAVVCPSQVKFELQLNQCAKSE